MKIKQFKTKSIWVLTFFVAILALVFFTLEYYSYQCIYADESKVPPSTKEHGVFGLPKPSLRAYIETYFTNNNKSWSIRDVYVENEHSNKAPILLLGDEIAMGLELNREDELSYQLAKKTGRPIYNRAINCPPMQTALTQVRDENLYKEIPKPEYIIFTFSRGCNIVTYRPYTYQLARYNPSIYYKKKGNYLVEDKIRPYLLRSTTYFWFATSQVIYSEPTLKMLDFLGLYFIEIRRAIEEHWGKDVKFVVMAYDTKEAIAWLQPLLDYLDKNDFIVLDINKITDKNLYDTEYLYPPAYWHPNEKAVKILVEALDRELGLK